MKFSLIVATKNRIQEVERFLRSLTHQNDEEFEVILVDQNPDNPLINIVEDYRQKFPIKHIQPAQSGTSRARNQGRLLAEGDIIAYPDDDCLYPPRFLTQVAQFFQQDSGWDGLIVRVMAIDSDQDAFDYSWQQSGTVDYEMGCYVGIAPSMFFRTSLAQKIAFDEEMGPGETWVGGEDTDYLLNCLDIGAVIYYNFELFVRHPQPYKTYNLRQLIQREFTYGRGSGYLMRKWNVPNPDVIRELIVPFQLAVKYTLEGNFRYALPCPAMGIGRLLGYWEGMKKFNQRKVQ